jgi:alpha-1,2-rhamnosyltransferase
MEKKPLRHFYIDCTNTFFDPYPDGISRVTRMLIELSGISREAGYGEVHPVVFSNSRHYILPTCDLFKDNPFAKEKSIRGIRKLGRRVWNKILLVLLSTDANTRFWLEKDKKLKKLFPRALPTVEETSLSRDDFLVLPEIFRDDQFPGLIELKKRLKLAVVVHDLIPITHPEYCDHFVYFNELFKFIAKNADLVVAVSRYSAACFNTYENLLENGGAILSRKKTEWFHLGSDPHGDSAPAPASGEMSGIFSDGVPVYLVCGTIEPRKNHLMVLRAFQQLWREGNPVKLLFVGRYGWKAEETVREMTRHPELNKRFFWLSRASDADLAHAYRRCHALIFASQVEGFGLPLVEALAKGKQVIFSRIKPFMEIMPAEFLINSFDPDQPEELLALVRETLRDNHRLELDKFKPTTWRQATKEFYRILAESPAA